MKTIDEIEGLTDEGNNTEYQELVFNAAFKGIMEAVIHPDTNQALFRNEDIIEALLNIQALVLHTSKEVTTPKKLRVTCERFAKDLRIKTKAFQKATAEGESPFDATIYLDERQ